MDRHKTSIGNFGILIFDSLVLIGNESEEIDGTGWSDKPVRNWCQEETINWLMSAASYMGQPYSSIQHSLAVPGKEIVTFTRQDFINHDPIYGDQLYDLLHSQHVSNLCMLSMYMYLIYINFNNILNSDTNSFNFRIIWSNFLYRHLDDFKKIELRSCLKND